MYRNDHGEGPAEWAQDYPRYAEYDRHPLSPERLASAIRRRAFALSRHRHYSGYGCDPLADWLQAERDIRARQAAAIGDPARGT